MNYVMLKSKLLFEKILKPAAHWSEDLAGLCVRLEAKAKCDVSYRVTGG